MVVDVCTYNGEAELWDIHYNVLKDYVDKFIVVEFDKTFSGKPKGPTFPVELYPDVTYCFHEETLYEKYRELAASSPNTQGADHWKREFMQKESIKDALTDLEDDDLVLIGDVDEIADFTQPIPLRVPIPIKLLLRVYTYWLNNRSSEIFWGTLLGHYGQIKNECLNYFRTYSVKTEDEMGWHFTSMGGPETLTKKLTDSYTQESYASSQILDKVKYNIARNKDFLGRNFSYMLDESQWPEFLQGNRHKYQHLIK